MLADPEQQQVDDYKAGYYGIKTAGSKAEDSQKRISYNDEESCRIAAQEAVNMAVDKIVLAIGGEFESS